MPFSVAPSPEVGATNLGVPGWSSTEMFGNNNKVNPTCCAVNTVEAGVSFTYQTNCTSYAIILEGGAQIVDTTKPGGAKTIKAGDVVYIEEGSTLTWTIVKKMKSFYVLHKQIGDFSPSVGGLIT
ncbi:hypothetical protein FRC09_003346 [Ceratobasidium sp. 395]|nr:hypothetical protein FRC09_003346 [Ceratobasidium sp. 395]